MNLLLSASDFIPFRELSLNLDSQTRLEPYIRQAQQLDLKPLLGEAFFEDITNTALTTAYQTLLNGGSYVYNNQNVSFSGLKTVLVLESYARFLENQNVNVTRFGVVYKNNADVSGRVDERTLQRLLTQAREQAKAYWAECELFLNRNTASYPLWQGCNHEGRSHVVITPVG